MRSTTDTVPQQLIVNTYLQSSTCSNTTDNTSTTSPNSTLCGGDCLGMSDSQYNLLYAIYAWT